MSRELEKLRKKRGYPVEHDDQTFYVRSLTLGELRRLDQLSQEDKTGFVVGSSLCSDQSGIQEIPKLESEDDQAYSKRVMIELDDVPTETIRALSEGVAAIGKAPKVESVIKN